MVGTLATLVFIYFVLKWMFGGGSWIIPLVIFIFCNSFIFNSFNTTKRILLEETTVEVESDNPKLDSVIKKSIDNAKDKYKRFKNIIITPEVIAEITREVVLDEKDTVIVKDTVDFSDPWADW